MWSVPGGGHFTLGGGGGGGGGGGDGGGTVCSSAECPEGHCALVQNVRGGGGGHSARGDNSVHRYCIRHHTTDRIANTNVKSGSCSGTKAVRLRGSIHKCSMR